MKYLTFFKKSKRFFVRYKLVRQIFGYQYKISILIPFSTNDPVRKKNFQWLLSYWKHELPDAQIIIGQSKSPVFSKCEALNDAFSRSSGKILAILDADAYLDGSVLENCADSILENMDIKLWYIPYRNLYRLTPEATNRVIWSDPKKPFRYGPNINPSNILNQGDAGKYGNRYGAMLMMFPREAITAIGGVFDEHFVGWGGEDAAIVKAIDTMYGKHKTVDAVISHLYHPFIGETHLQRTWVGQEKANMNGNRTMRYYAANMDPKKMKVLIDEAVAHKRLKQLLEKS